MNARQGQGGVNLLDFTTNGEKKKTVSTGRRRYLL